MVALQRADDDWVKKCMEYEVEGPRHRGRPKRAWREVVQEDSQARKMNKEDAICHGRVQTCGPMGACIACLVISIGGMCGRCWS